MIYEEINQVINLEVLIKDLTEIMKETIDASTRDDLKEVIRGLETKDSCYWQEARITIAFE